MIPRLLESGLGVDEIAWSQILPTATAMVANQAQVVRLLFLAQGTAAVLTSQVYPIARLLSLR